MSPRFLWLALGLGVASRSSAQAVGHTGMQVERLHWKGNRQIAVTARHAELGRRGWGADVALGLMPVFLPEVVLPFEAGLARGVALGPATTVVKAGGAGIFIGQQVRLIPGIQMGAAVIVPVQERLELRIDTVGRRYWPAGSDAVGMWSVGIGFAVRGGPRRAEPPRSSP